MEKFIDITEMTESPKAAMRAIGQIISKDTLEYVNKHDSEVTPRNSLYTRYGKRVLDLVLSSVALAVTLPVNSALAVGTYLDVGRPIFFSQKRVGKDGKLFTIVKFRNMTNERDANGDLLPGKDRVTRFGKFVRRTSLDELLNFWSIFKGDMSIIGPRPLPEGYNERLSERHKKRWTVKPGLECPIIKKATDKLTWTDQFENDVWYVENVSLLTDMRMILALAKITVNKKSTAVRSAAARGSFMGYNKDGSSISSDSIPVTYYQQFLTEKK